MRTIWTIEQEQLAKQYARVDSSEFIKKVGRTKAAANSHFYYCKSQGTVKLKRTYKRRTNHELVIVGAPSVEMIKDAERRQIAVRSLTATICGDPCPGYSALDMKK